MALPIPQLKWGAHYHVGVEEVDHQHEHIAAVINTLGDTLRQGDQRTQQLALLDELLRRSAAHFEYEESLMQRTRCPDFELHKAEHEYLAAQVINFKDQFAEEFVQLDEAFLTFLRDWLRNHMMVADRRMSRHLRAVGAGPCVE
jgi:hemerythrin-like metal-binding protein